MGYYNKYAYKTKLNQRGMVKSKWMQIADDTIKQADDDRTIQSRHDYWDTLTHLYNTGKSPSEAAAVMLQHGEKQDA